MEEGGGSHLPGRAVILRLREVQGLIGDLLSGRKEVLGSHVGHHGGVEMWLPLFH